MASEIYAVQQNDVRLKLFLGRAEFSNRNQVMKAEVGSRLINTKDGFGVCVRGGKGYDNDLFLIFRGSTKANFGADWISNARIGVETSDTGLPVHIGFNHIFRSMRSAVQEFLGKHPDVASIHCIGHSLGGAVATLAADWVKRHTGKHVVLYTFGAPKPGFEFFSNKLTQRLGADNIHRVYHATDPVPMIPLYPFTHAPLPGYGHYLNSSDSLLSAAAHGMEKYIASVSTVSWLSLSGPPPMAGHDKVIERWLKSDRSVNPLSPKTWHWINAGLQYVLTKVLGATASVLQAPFIMGLTLADKIAWMLRKGIDLSVGAGEWVWRLMRKMMQVLGMKVADTVAALTRALMRSVLGRVMEKLNAEARRAIQQLIVR